MRGAGGLTTRFNKGTASLFLDMDCVVRVRVLWQVVNSRQLPSVPQPDDPNPAVGVVHCEEKYVSTDSQLAYFVRDKRRLERPTTPAG